MRQQNARGEVARPFDSWKKYFHVSTVPPFIIVMFLHFPLFSFPRFSIFHVSALSHVQLTPFTTFSTFLIRMFLHFPPFLHFHVSPFSLTPFLIVMFPLFSLSCFSISTFLDSTFPHFPVSPFSSLLDRPRSRLSIAPRRSTSCPSGTFSKNSRRTRWRGSTSSTAR